ncbi:MAG: hypothetical protein RI968_48, partial [Pseudomonadota bacterium]
LGFSSPRARPGREIHKVKAHRKVGFFIAGLRFLRMRPRPSGFLHISQWHQCCSGHFSGVAHLGNQVVQMSLE